MASDEDEFQPASEDDSDDSEYKAKISKRYSETKEKGKSQTSQCPSKIKKSTKKEEEEEAEEQELEELDDELDEKIEKKKKGGKKRQRKGDDEWIEVYLKGAKRWVCVDVDQGVGQPELCYSQATQPVTYVVGVDENGYLKDVSSRYDPNWLTSSRKRRIDSEWWAETLCYYECPDSEQKKEEDKEVPKHNKYVHIFTIYYRISMGEGVGIAHLPLLQG